VEATNAATAKAGSNGSEERKEANDNRKQHIEGVKAIVLSGRATSTMFPLYIGSGQAIRLPGANGRKR
jgi:hypothetical protein